MGVKHSTAADGSFTPAGKTAWEADHVDGAGLPLPTFSFDSSNNPVGLMGPNGSVLSQLPIGVPSGMSAWISDTLPQIDIYAAGLVKNPTIFFDPSASSSLNLGTLKNPYTTYATLDRVLAGLRVNKGHLGGQVLGIKRGTVLRGGMVLTDIAGASGNPFYIVPYGDALALPILAGMAVSASWATTNDSNIWKLSGIAADSDVFNQAFVGSAGYVKRYLKVSNSGVTDDASAITALNGVGTATTHPGRALWCSGNTTLYIRDFTGQPDWTQVEYQSVNYGLDMAYSNIAASGYVTIAGLDVRGGRNSAIRFVGGTTGNITTLDQINIIGCRHGQAGYDAASTNVAADSLLLYGVSDSVRASNVNVAGNYCYDCLNNGVELGAISSGSVAQNVMSDCYGRAIAELWFSCSNVSIHDNFASGTYGKSARLSSYGNCGVAIAGWTTSGGASSSATKNTGNSIFRNVMLNIGSTGGQAALDNYGAATKLYNNTITHDNSSSTGGVVCQNQTGDSSYPGLDMRNNIIRGLVDQSGVEVYVKSASSTFASQNNCFSNSSGNNFKAQVGATGYYDSSPTNINNWNTANYGGLTDVSVAVNPQVATSGLPATSSLLSAGAVITGYTDRDINGATYTTNPAIGAVYA